MRSDRRLDTFSRRALEGAPTLAIEVLSPSTSRTDRGTKRQLYAATACRITGSSILRASIEVHDRAGAGEPAPRRFDGTPLASLPPFD